VVQRDVHAEPEERIDGPGAADVASCGERVGAARTKVGTVWEWCADRGRRGERARPRGRFCFSVMRGRSWRSGGVSTAASRTDPGSPRHQGATTSVPCGLAPPREVMKEESRRGSRASAGVDRLHPSTRLTCFASVEGSTLSAFLTPEVAQGLRSASPHRRSPRRRDAVLVRPHHRHPTGQPGADYASGCDGRGRLTTIRLRVSRRLRDGTWGTAARSRNQTRTREWLDLAAGDERRIATPCPATTTPVAGVHERDPPEDRLGSGVQRRSVGASRRGRGAEPRTHWGWSRRNQ